MKKQLLKFSVIPFLIFGFSILYILTPILRSGFFSVHDETHIVDLYEMVRSLETGGLPPRWVPDFNFGLGYPYFNFYYHLPFYISSIFHYIGFSLTQSFKYVMLVFVVTAATGFYFFAKRHLSKQASILAAALYIFSPYFAVDLYVRGALGELAVFAMVPWVLYGINRFVEKSNVFNFAVAALFIALLTLSHNVLHLFIFPVLFLYGVINIFNLEKKLRFKKLLSLIGLFLIGILLAAYYWLPALVETQYISSYEQINLSDQFPFIKQLIIPHWGYSVSHWGPDDDISFNIGIINLLAVLFSILGIKFVNKKNRKVLMYFLAVFFIAVLLMNQRTEGFWNLSKILRMVQFPWRLLILTNISTAFILGIVSESIFERFNKKRIFISSLLMIFIVGLTISYFHPSEYKEISDEKYMELYFANRTTGGDGVRGALSPDYLNFAEDFIPPTKWQTARLKALPKNLVESSKSADLIFTQKNLDISASVNSQDNNVIYFNTAYFPGWTGYMDKKPQELKPAKEIGIISMDIPKGMHNIEVKFEDTPVRRLANIISLSALLILLGSLVFRKVRRVND